jgi:hypothetical protein
MDSISLRAPIATPSTAPSAADWLLMSSKSSFNSGCNENSPLYSMEAMAVAGSWPFAALGVVALQNISG